MDLLGTFRVKIITPGLRKEIGATANIRKWSKINIFSVKEKYRDEIQTIEVKKKRRSSHPGYWIEGKKGKKFWQRDDKKGEYREWFQTIIKQKVVKVRLQDPIEKLIIKLHGTEHVVKLEDIQYWQMRDKDRIPSIIENPPLKEAGPTPIHKPLRNLASEEQIARLDYLKSFGYPENTLNTMMRGYSAKDIKKARQTLAKKVDGKRIPATKKEAEEFLQKRIEDRKHQKEVSRKK